MNTRTLKQAGITLHHVRGRVPRTFWSETYHAHDHAEIFLHVRGKMTLFIENNIYCHNGNEIRLYAPHEYHFGKSDTEQEMEWYQISLDAAFLSAYPALADIIVNRARGCDNVFISTKQEAILSLTEEIFLKQNSPLGEHYFSANIMKILCLLNESQNNIKVKMGKNESLQIILNTVNQNLTQIRTVEDITALTYFSPSYIHRLFKNNLNITPHQYVHMKKLSNAKEMLAQGASISDACFASGFSDYANFITAFRKHFGVTPKNHRNAKF